MIGAAEKFHDLHEEVMATATRGHGLMVRVQQLEADFPTVEEALFYYRLIIHHSFQIQDRVPVVQLFFHNVSLSQLNENDLNSFL